MARTVAEMTPSDLRAMLGELIEEKLVELIGDPDEDQEIRTSVVRRLRAQQSRAAAGERGRDLEEVVRTLGQT
jgi:hypothetical protein